MIGRAACSLVGAALALSAAPGVVLARDTLLTLPLPYPATAEHRQTGRGVQGIHFAGQAARPSGTHDYEQVAVVERMRLQSDRKAACRGAFMRAAKVLRLEARARGGIGVVEVVSNWKGREFSSATSYVCAVSRRQAAVALKGYVLVQARKQSVVVRKRAKDGTRLLRVTIGNPTVASRFTWRSSPEPTWVRVELAMRRPAGAGDAAGPHAGCPLVLRGEGVEERSVEVRYRATTDRETLTANLLIEHIRALSLGQVALDICETHLSLSDDFRAKLGQLLQAIRSEAHGRPRARRGAP